MLIGLVGTLLVYAASHPEVRAAILVVAIVEKAVFALGVLLSPFRRRKLALGMALADAGMASVYALYLAGV